MLEVDKEFPSPTGVNHYELAGVIYRHFKLGDSFRPQQGLIIMNCSLLFVGYYDICFRPQQGLIIMNFQPLLFQRFLNLSCFRPQQGLIIMNCLLLSAMSSHYTVSVPNRG